MVFICREILFFIDARKSVDEIIPKDYISPHENKKVLSPFCYKNIFDRK